MNASNFLALLMCLNLFVLSCQPNGMDFASDASDLDSGEKPAPQEERNEGKRAKVTKVSIEPNVPVHEQPLGDQNIPPESFFPPPPPAAAPFIVPVGGPIDDGVDDGERSDDDHNVTCKERPSICNDKNPCTIDACVDSRCTHTFDSSKTEFGSCESDGHSCTVGKCVDVNDSIFCQEQPREFIAEPVGCRDDNQCTADSCIEIPLTGEEIEGLVDHEGRIHNKHQCVQEVMENVECFAEDACLPGICTISGTGMPDDEFAVSCVQNASGSPEPFCPNPDFNVCTVETCVVGVGCVSSQVPTDTLCNDFDPCTTNDQCQTDSTIPNSPQFYCFGEARVAVPINEPGGLDDGNPCTMDTCSAGIGTHTNISGPFGPDCETRFPGICAAGNVQCLDGVLETGMCIPMFRPGDKIESCAVQNGLDDNCDGQIDECDCPAIPDGAIRRYADPDGDDTSNDCTDIANPCQTIAHAIAVASSGDVVFLAPKTFNEFNVTVNKNLLIYGAGSDFTLVDAAQQGRVFLVNPMILATFCDMTIANGRVPTDSTAVDPATIGAGIRNEGDTLVTHCVVTGNTAVRGAGITNLGTLTVDNSTISNNMATVNGGAIRNENSGTTTVTSSIITGNSSEVGGGIVVITGTVNVGSNSTISNNRAIQGGGISTNSGTTLAVTDSFVVNNAADIIGSSLNLGGGITSGGTTTITNTVLNDNNSIGNGGALYSGGSLTMLGSTLNNNKATNNGGGIINFGTGTITNSVISNNNASFGGGIVSAPQASLSISLSTIYGNTALAAGGYYNSGATLTLTDSTVTNNFATTNNGGGILNFGTSVSAPASLTIVTSTISNNYAGDSGGGIESFGAFATGSITNSTVSSNEASLAGGGIRNVTGSLTLSSATIANNISSDGAGIKNLGVVRSGHSIVAAQASGADCSGALTSQGHNLEGATSCGFTGTGDLQNKNATVNLGPLQNNGGPTFTHALGVGSAAINTSDMCGLPTDQRGEPRPTPCDIGSFEVQP